jgi:3-O-methylgallate 3,4-dioxygenase
MRKTDELSPSVPEDLDAQLQPATLEQRFGLVQKAVETLSRTLQCTADLDAIVIFGDDQHEQFGDGNMPAIAVYHGDACDVQEPRRAHIPWTVPAEQRDQISSLMESTHAAYPGAAAFGRHITESLTDQDFDVARCDRLNDRGLGHAFAFLYQRLWQSCTVPIVPIMLNTYYPPNQPTPRRSYALGKAVRAAVGSWTAGKRVAVIASGGLSHIVVEEPLDRQILDGLADHDPGKTRRNTAREIARRHLRDSQLNRTRRRRWPDADDVGRLHPRVPVASEHRLRHGLRAVDKLSVNRVQFYTSIGQDLCLTPDFCHPGIDG